MKVRTNAWLVGAIAAAVVGSGASTTGIPPPLQGPIVHDGRLELQLVASDPDIVTPIGIAIDGRDRLFVLESHTHVQPRG